MCQTCQLHPLIVSYQFVGVQGLLLFLTFLFNFFIHLATITYNCSCTSTDWNCLTTPKLFSIKCTAAVIACGSKFSTLSNYFGLIGCPFLGRSTYYENQKKTIQAIKIVRDRKLNIYFQKLSKYVTSNSWYVGVDARHANIVNSEQNTTSCVCLHDRFVFSI